MAVYAGNDQNEIPRISPDYVPPQSAGEKFPISFWNYRYVGEGMTPVVRLDDDVLLKSQVEQRGNEKGAPPVS